MKGLNHLITLITIGMVCITILKPQPATAQTVRLDLIATPTDLYRNSATTLSDNPHYYLYPYNLHLTSGATSSVPLTVIDDNRNTIPGTISFSGYDASLISISADGYVTALRAENSSEIGTWVSASVNGVQVIGNTIVRVLSTQYSVPFSQVSSQHTVLYYPTIINGENLSAYVSQFEMSTVNEDAYAIQSQLMGLQPFDGAKQVYEIDFGESETQRVCGISGDPIRLGWNISGNEWQNCFLVPFISPRSPQWNVMYHEMGHNFTLDSQSFNQGLGMFEYTEGLATAISIATLRTILTDSSTYPLGTDATASLQQQFTMVTTTMSDNFQTWLNDGADFSQLNPDIVDGIWLYYQAQRPVDFELRFFTPLQPRFLSLVLPILADLNTTDHHTIFAALVSAARGQDLSAPFSDTYHYPINGALFPSAYSLFTHIMDNTLPTIYLPLIIR